MKSYLIDVYIADDHQMVCEGLSELINNSGKAHVSMSSRRDRYLGHTQAPVPVTIPHIWNL